MSEEINTTTEKGVTGTKDDIANKKKRIKRMKTIIIFFLILLFLLPTFLCIALGIQLNKLQEQVDNLASTYSNNDSYNDKDREKTGKNYAYASTDEHIEQADESIVYEDINIIIGSDGSDVSIDIDASEGLILDNDNVDTENINDIENIDDTMNNNAMNDIENTADVDDTKNNNDMNDIEDTADVDDTKNNNGMNNIENTENIDHTEHVDDSPKKDPNGIYYNKKVYLTFDDGPSNITDSILDTLAEYNVKATFFVIGHDDLASKERYKRIVNEGHVIAIHSYSHKYNNIYKSLEDFDKDFTKLWKLLYDTTGYTPTLYRFPGGSLMKSKSIDIYNDYLKERGMTYYDWNVVNGDAEGIDYTEDQMINNVLNGVAKKKTSIVLMHDGWGKEKTAATLPKILDALISGGADVLPMDENVPLIQQVKAKSVK